jgi:hypothetical protein
LITFFHGVLTNFTEVQIMKRVFLILFTATLLIVVFTACQKDSNGSYVKPPIDTQPPPPPPPPGITLSYGDSIFYLSAAGTNIISPKPLSKLGKFYGFPDGIELDSLNGNIDIANSETGLRYKIMFIPDGTTDTVSTKIVLSGINFYDHIYHITKGDSIATPVYNANGKAYAPGLFGTGTTNIFDDGNGCNNQGCNVSLANGSINLTQSLRSGAIPSTHDSQKEFVYYYRMDDKSGKTLNKLKVKLYYYNKMADIPQYLWDILLVDHAGTILRTTMAQRVAKPRPPCMIIVAD